MNISDKDRNCSLNIIKLSNSNFTNTGKETLAEMLIVHFSASNAATGATPLSSISTKSCGKSKWDIAKKGLPLS